MTDALYKYFQAQHNSAVIRFMLMAAEQAQNGMPYPQGDDLNARTSSIRAFYQGMISQIHEHTGVRSYGEELRIDQVHVNDRKEAREEQIGNLTEQLRNTTIDLNRVKLRYPWKYYKLVQLGKALVLGGEATFNAAAFQILRTPLWTALLLGASVAVASAWWAKLVLRYLADATHPAQRTRRIWASIVMTGLVFAALGLLRAQWIDRNTDVTFMTTGGHIAMFTIINLGLVGVLTAMEFYASPTTQDRLDLERKQEFQSKSSDLSKKIALLRTANSREREELDNSYKERHRELVRIKELEQQVKEWFAEAIGRYMEENCLRRTDGSVPSCFSQRIEPIRGRLDDIEL